MAANSKTLQLANQVPEKTVITAMLSRRYKNLLHSEKFVDCIFHVGVTTVKCHKLILSAASPVFEAMFFGPIREQQEIDILDFTPEIFKVLIEYIYTGSIDFQQLTLEETIELYYGAEKYLLSELIVDCLCAIARKLRFSNILPALELSVCMDLNGLLEVCMSFFLRCCLGDAQYMAYLKSNYLHISKYCMKSIIAAAKKEQHKQLLWFVYEWCQQECSDLGLQKNDCAIIIDDLQLNENVWVENSVLSNTKPNMQQCCSIERCYYKASRPFIVGSDAHKWTITIKSDRFISLLGIIINSRLAPNVATMLAATTHMSPALSTLSFPTEYFETLHIEICAQNPTPMSAHRSYNEDRDGEATIEQTPTVIWQHSAVKQPIKYNCDLNINWNNGVILSPDVEYQIKLIWDPTAYGAEYPCSLQSNVVDGIEFKDFNGQYGSLFKGLRYINLV